MPKMIFGINPVLEALRSDKPPEKIFVMHNAGGPSINAVFELATTKKILYEKVGKLRFTQIGGGKNHQGVAALISEYDYATIPQILEIAAKRNEPPYIALLDGITDPHNLGAVIRSAECAGVHGIIIPKHRAVGMTEVVAKTSAGALAHMAIAKVTNLANAIDELKEAGVWIAGTDQAGESSLHETNFTGPIGIIIGSEGSGMRRLVKEKCDFMVQIPMKGKISSLNASVAAALLFFEVSRQRDAKIVTE